MSQGLTTTKVREVQLNLSDVTTANATTLQHGLLKKLSGSASELLNGAGNWITNLTGVKLGSLTTNGPVFTSGGDGTLNSEATLAIARGGTASATAADARTALGLAIGTNVQAWDAQLTSIAALAYAGNALKVVRVNAGETDFEVAAAGTGTVTDVSVVTANGVSGSVATSTTTPAISLTLGAITPTTVNGNTITTGTGTLTLGAGKTLTASNTLTFTGTDTSTLNIGTGGTLGTAAYTAATAYQASDAELTAIAGLTSAADRVPYFTGSGTAALATFTEAGRNLVDDADASAQRTTLGLAIGTNVQAYSANLTTWAGKTAPSGAVLGNTDIQSVGSKNLEDASVAFMDDGDNTKKMRFQCSGITTATTRTLTVPDASGTIALTSDLAAYLTTAAAAAAYQPLDADLTSWAAVTRAAGFDTFAATPSSANLRSLVTDESGTGALVFADTPTLIAPLLGTPTSGTLTNCTGLSTAGLVDAAVTLAKIQDASAASKLLGRGGAAGAGDFEEITLGTGLSMSGTTLNAASGAGDMILASAQAVTGAKTFDSSALLLKEYGGGSNTLTFVCPVLALDASITFPDGSYTLATLSKAETLQNKNIAGATISGHIDNDVDDANRLGTSATRFQWIYGKWIYASIFANPSDSCRLNAQTVLMEYDASYGTAPVIQIDEASATPSSPTESAQANIYVRGDRLIVQFNDAGTVRYKSMLLSGTGSTWNHSTTAPT